MWSMTMHKMAETLYGWVDSFILVLALTAHRMCHLLNNHAITCWYE
jgi:hypothetical protein